MNPKEKLLSIISLEIEKYIDEDLERRIKNRVRDEVTPNPHESMVILTAEEISKYLGVSRKIIYELLKINVENGGIPNFKIGNSRRVDRRDLYKWIEDRKREHIDHFQK